MRIERSVLDYFRAPGKEYQTRIDRVLESYVRAQRRRWPHRGPDMGEAMTCKKKRRLPGPPFQFRGALEAGNCPPNGKVEA